MQPLHGLQGCATDRLTYIWAGLLLPGISLVLNIPFVLTPPLLLPLKHGCGVWPGWSFNQHCTNCCCGPCCCRPLRSSQQPQTEAP